jgi:hypothetical protein
MQSTYQIKHEPVSFRNLVHFRRLLRGIVKNQTYKLGIKVLINNHCATVVYNFCCIYVAIAGFLLSVLADEATILSTIPSMVSSVDVHNP